MPLAAPKRTALISPLPSSPLLSQLPSVRRSLLGRLGRWRGARRWRRGQPRTGAPRPSPFHSLPSTASFPQPASQPKPTAPFHSPAEHAPYRASACAGAPRRRGGHVHPRAQGAHRRGGAHARRLPRAVRPTHARQGSCAAGELASGCLLGASEGVGRASGGASECFGVPLDASGCF